MTAHDWTNPLEHPVPPPDAEIAVYLDEGVYLRDPNAYPWRRDNFTTSLTENAALYPSITKAARAFSDADRVSDGRASQFYRAAPVFLAVPKSSTTTWEPVR